MKNQNNSEAAIAYTIGLAAGFAVLSAGAAAIMGVGGVLMVGAVLVGGDSDD
jgi:hypothetical protein